MCKEGKEKREYERNRVSHCHIMLMKRNRTMRYTPNAEFHDSDQSLCLFVLGLAGQKWTTASER